MKIECVHVRVTGSPCCTVEKKIIGEITTKKDKKMKRQPMEWEKILSNYSN